MYKAGDLAHRLDIHPNTIRNWADSYAQFMSEHALGKANAARRRFTEHDALVLATIADLRAKGLTPEQIVESLNAGQLIDRLPDLPTEEEEEARKSVSLVPLATLQRALDQVRVLESEIDRVRHERDLALEQRDRSVAELTQHVAALREQLGRAEGRLESADQLRGDLQKALDEIHRLNREIGRLEARLDDD